MTVPCSIAFGSAQKSITTLIHGARGPQFFEDEWFSDAEPGVLPATPIVRLDRQGTRDMTVFDGNKMLHSRTDA